MAVLNKHLEKAEKLLQKEKYEAALEELLIARKEEPSNDTTILKLADTYQSLNRPRDRRQCYAALFDKYAEKGETVKALEYFAQVKNAGPVEPKRLVACGRLLEKRSARDAAEYFRLALETPGALDQETALQCLESLAALEPGSLDLQQRVAELALKTGKTALAASSFNRVGELLMQARQYPEAVEAFERAYHASGENPAAKLVLAKACSYVKLFPRVLELLGPAADQQPEDPQILTLVAEAYLAERQLPQAEAVYWKLTKSSLDAFDPLTDIAIEYLRGKNPALPLLERLEKAMEAAKHQKGLIALAEKMNHLGELNVASLGFLSHLADRMHLDGPLSNALQKQFEIYFAAEEYDKATDALERLIDIDAYAPECTSDLKRLEGKADPAIWKDMAARLGRTSTSSAAQPPATAPAAGSPAADAPTEVLTENTLGDLILQAEIFLQYKLLDKARDRLARIARLFPGEEEKNVELRALFDRAEFTPSATSTMPRAAVRTVDLHEDWNRISEVIRNLGRQATVKGVLSATVNEIGRLWQASRCVAGLASPKHPPSVVLEYIAPGIKASDGGLLSKLVMGLQQSVEEHGFSLVAEKVSQSPQLAPLKTLLTALQVDSLVAVPLHENDQPIGILILEQCGGERSWKVNDLAALDMIAGQTVLALTNARLRSLMKTLAVADERSGLLHRDSYLPCLISEAERMQAQKVPMTVALLHFGGPSSERREGSSDGALNDFMQQFPAALASHLRQNDIAVNYGPHSLAVIMPGTTGKQALFMVEKIRKVSASVAAGAAPAPAMAAGVAEAVSDSAMDREDLVTELINRVEWAWEEAQAAGESATKVLDPPSLPH